MNNNNNNFNADKCILHYETRQLLHSTDLSSNGAVKTSSSESLIACEAEICDAVRRRGSSKGSRKTMPTMLLNANPGNFRALVQKFTGRSAGVDLSGGRKGPLTLDFRSPASVSKEVIFPSSVDLHNYDCTINRHVGDGESHVTCEWEGAKAVSYQMGQLSKETNDYALSVGYDDDHAHGHHDYHDDGDLLRGYLENSSFDGVDYMGYDDFYHDGVLLECLMRDLDF